MSKFSPTLIVFLMMFLPVYMGTSCRDEKEEKCEQSPDIDSVPMMVEIFDFADSVLQFKSKKDVDMFFTRHPIMRDRFFNRPNYPNDSIFINTLYHRFNNEGIRQLRKETVQIFGDEMEELKKELREAFRSMKYYYPDFNPPIVKTVITGLESDIYVSKKLVIIGLDYYLGSSAKYRPQLHRYMLRRYQKNFIVPSIILLYGISNEYNQTDLDDQTVLADMIAYGKAYFFAKKMLPCISDSTLIGYTKEELIETKKYSTLIWKRLIEDEVLYSTSTIVKRKYLSERPKTLEIGNKCPGRIATWVGWEIISQYMEKNSGVTLPEMMAISDAQSIFNDSKYKPE